MPTPASCLVIFDCDGVLVDSERLAVGIDVRAIRAVGWELTEAEVIERFVGRSDTDVIAEIEQHLGRPLPSDWVERWAREYRSVFDAQLTTVPGVVDAIGDLVARGFATYVASSGSHAKMRHTLSTTGLWGRFDGRIVSASEVAHGKPAPDLFLHAARRAGYRPDRCVVVEDSRFGVAGAKAAGMKAVGFAGGITPAVALAEADVVITDMADLVPVIEGLLL